MVSINYESQRLTYFTQEKERYERKLKDAETYTPSAVYNQKQIDNLKAEYAMKVRFYTDAIEAFK